MQGLDLRRERVPLQPENCAKRPNLRPWNLMSASLPPVDLRPVDADQLRKLGLGEPASLASVSDVLLDRHEFFI